MKRMFWSLAMVLIVGISTIAVIYQVRKKAAEEQYVYAQSENLLSIAVDDIVLDNLGYFIKVRKDSTPTTPSLFHVKTWWNAGIRIAAQIHLFTMTEDPLTYFSIQKINNKDQWEQFINTYRLDSVQHSSSGERDLSFVNLSSGIRVMYDNTFALFRFGIPKDDQYQDMQLIWDDRDRWLYVKDLDIDNPEKPKSHVVYRNVTGDMQLFGDVSDGNMELSGQWHLGNDLPIYSRRRELLTDDTFVAFWTALPINEIPLITRFMSMFGSVDNNLVTNSSYNYVDLFVGSGTTVQKDTVISYDYDEDFNSVEVLQLQEIDVPLIESVWRADTALADALPDNFFYHFYKQRTDSLVYLSTKDDIMFPNFSASTAVPLGFVVDFRNVPSCWSSTLAPWKDKEVVLKVETSISDNMMRFTGSISYQ